MTAIEAGFKNMSGIDNIIGAVDGTYVKIDAPPVDQEAYINRKCFHSITLQAICDHKMRYTDCFVGYPSSVHDCRIFRNSDIYKSVRASQTAVFPENKFILGDKAYPSLLWCLVPFKETRVLSAAQKRFNTKHSSARQTVERSFALLFGRFRRLKHLQMKRQDLIPKTVLAACVLHNICLDFKDNITFSNVELLAINDNGDAAIAESSNDNENSREALEMRQRICNQISQIHE
jgi:hypothetical protein